MRRRNFLWSVLLAALGALIAGCIAPAPAPTPIRCNGRVVAFTATWCGPCQKAKPFLVQVQAAGVAVQIVDIDAQPELARQYHVMRVPTFLVFMCGKPMVRTNDVSVMLSMTQRGCL